MSGQVLCVMEKSGFSATDFVAEVQRALAGDEVIEDRRSGECQQQRGGTWPDGINDE